MEVRELTKALDHTILRPTATWEQVSTLLDEAVKYHVASAVIPPSYVAKAKEYVGNAVPICTVIGFPNGYQTTAVKVFETQDAIASGADEIDIVINIGWVKEGRFDDVLTELKALRQATQGKILKVIIETDLLEEKEKVTMCQLVTQAEADFIKTSTGFVGAGATVQDIMLLMGNIGPNVQVKASGGISTIEDARRFLALGATRIGASRIISQLPFQSMKKGATDK